MKMYEILYYENGERRQTIPFAAENDKEASREFMRCYHALLLDGGYTFDQAFLREITANDNIRLLLDRKRRCKA